MEKPRDRFIVFVAVVTLQTPMVGGLEPGAAKNAGLAGGYSSATAAGRLNPRSNSLVERDLAPFHLFFLVR